MTEPLFEVPGPHVEYVREALLSRDGRYRYSLRRRWREGRTCMFVCLNPSTADAYRDDATVRRMVGYAKRWDCGELVVGNLFAYRATDPKALQSFAFEQRCDPIGVDNRPELVYLAGRADVIVCAWGNHTMVRRFRSWAYQLVQLLREHGPEPMCLGLTRDGHPLHPLRQPARARLVPLGAKYLPRERRFRVVGGGAG